MPRYISLLRFTEQGLSAIKRSANRAHAFDRAAEKVGVTVEGQYWTHAPYEGAIVINADSEVGALQLLSELAAEGNVRSDTMLSEHEEFDRLAG